MNVLLEEQLARAVPEWWAGGWATAQLSSAQLIPMNGKEKSHHVVPVVSSEFYVNATADVVEDIFLKSGGFFCCLGLFFFLIYSHSTYG